MKGKRLVVLISAGKTTDITARDFHLMLLDNQKVTSTEKYGVQ